jgi:Polysaccharide pyruvyl transferase
MKFHVRCYTDGTKVAKPPKAYRITFGFIGSLSGPALRDTNPNGLGTTYRNFILGMGIIDAKGSRISPRKSASHEVLGVRGPLSRDLFLVKQGINPEVVADPGLYFYPIFQNEVAIARNESSITSQSRSIELLAQNQLTSPRKDLCFISHEVENDWFRSNLTEYTDVTFRAGKLGDGGDIYEAVQFMSTCETIVSSSLHGVIFAHSLSIPALPIQVTTKLFGGEFKFIDYYHGINLTSFRSRYSVETSGMPNSKSDWIDLVHSFPQPKFPYDFHQLRHFDIFKSIFRKD